MDIIPDTAAATLFTQLQTVVTDNIVGLLGLTFAGVAVSFVMRWFHKAKKVRA